jgi:hypothetical protein
LERRGELQGYNTHHNVEYYGTQPIDRGKTLSKSDNHPRGHVKMTIFLYPYKLMMVDIQDMKDGL